MSLLLTLTALGLSATANALIDFQPCPELNAEIGEVIGGQGVPFDCATLPVPLDYTNPDSAELDLALFRVNATEEPVLGSVLINFGGPGGTGAENLPAWGERAQAVIGAQWNLISWDPRGTGYTIPFNCSLAAFLGESIVPPSKSKRDVGNLVSANLTEVFLNGGWEAAGQYADFCAERSNETATLIGTAFVARDMIEIVNALEEDGLLRYYGWSYGTALGSYVAAMFPERVERVVLDANVNPHNYAAGTYADFADNIDEEFAGFVDSCFNSTDDCALYSFLQPNSSQDILDAINLALTPFVEAASTNMTNYWTLSTLKGTLYQPMYFPAQWPSFAETLAGLLNGSMPDPPPATSPYGAADNAVVGIRASDATFIANSSDEYLPIVQYQATVSPGFSDTVYFLLWPSAQWRMPAKERYFGDFNVQTKNPILYVNGMFDPVTPLVDAQNASATFQGSVLLQHGGYGHGVFADPSACVAEHVQAYFRNGTLPAEGTFCEPNTTPVELFAAAAAAGGDSATGGNGSGNSTSDEGDASNDEGSADDSSTSEDAAAHLSNGVTFALAAALAVVALVAQ
jgi:pimeloyl-ACP methyl ester carboxylesterase